MRILISAIFTFSFVVNCQATSLSCPESLSDEKIATPTKKRTRSDDDLTPSPEIDPQILPPRKRLKAERSLPPKKRARSRDDLSTDQGASPQPVSPRKRLKTEDSPSVRPELKVNPLRYLESFDDIEPGDLIAPQGTTVVFFDLDHTLIQHKIRLFHMPGAEQDEVLNQFYEQGMFEGTVDDFKYFKSYIAEVQNHLSIHSRMEDEEFVEPLALPFMQGLKAKGAVLIGLTARNILIANLTDRTLKKLNADFSDLSGLRSLDLKKGPLEIKKGISYTCNRERKFNLIPAILETAVEKTLKKKGPYMCHHFDDNTDELHAFNQDKKPENVTSYPITIQPVFYKGYDKLTMPTINLERIFAEIKALHSSDGFKNWLELKKKLEKADAYFGLDAFF